LSSAIVEDRKCLRLGQPADMYDQRVEAWSAFGREDLGDGAFVARIAAEPVDGLGREDNEPAGFQQPGGAGDRPEGGGRNQSG
jgi:hypothetical protein